MLGTMLTDSLQHQDFNPLKTGSGATWRALKALGLLTGIRGGSLTIGDGAWGRDLMSEPGPGQLSIRGELLRGVWGETDNSFKKYDDLSFQQFSN